MCFTAIVYGRDKLEAKDLLLICMEEYLGSNPHGFALRQFPEEEAFRTMSKYKFVNHALKCNSKNLHFHFRFSTNMISEEFVHLWRGKNFTFGHNGVISNISHLNDSLGFLEKIKDDIANFNYTKISEYLSTFEGYGVFTIMYDSGESLLISINKSIKITKFGESLMFSSDTPRFKTDKFKYEHESIIQFKGFEFVSATEREVPMLLKKSITNEAENCLIHVDSNGKLLDMTDLDIKRSSNPNFPNRFSGKTYKDERQEWEDSFDSNLLYGQGNLDASLRNNRGIE